MQWQWELSRHLFYEAYYLGLYAPLLLGAGILDALALYCLTRSHLHSAMILLSLGYAFKLWAFLERTHTPFHSSHVVWLLAVTGLPTLSYPDNVVAWCTITSMFLWQINSVASVVFTVGNVAATLHFQHRKLIGPELVYVWYWLGEKMLINEYQAIH